MELEYGLTNIILNITDAIIYGQFNQFKPDRPYDFDKNAVLQSLHKH